MGRLTMDGSRCRCALATAVLGVSVAWFSLGAIAADGEAKRFDRNTVQELARKLAADAYLAGREKSSRDARFAWRRDDAANATQEIMDWSLAGVGFKVRPLPPSDAGSPSMDLYLVDDGRARHFAFDRSAYEIDKSNPKSSEPGGGFAGVHIERLGAASDAAGGGTFLANGFYEAVGQGQVAGATARPMKVRWRDKGEETLAIRTLWIERPSAGVTSIVVHALLDAPSLSAACHYTLRPGVATIIDVECSVFARVALEQLGIGAVHAAHYIGPMVKPILEDVRPQVNEVTGLEMLSGNDEWIWRPVGNRSRLEVSAFVDHNPKGFGLVQKRRDIAAYLDDVNQWQRRPTVWIEPINAWAEGEVVLQEIPAPSPLNKNIIAYWRPKAAVQGKSEVSFAYRQYWGWGLPDKIETAVVSESRAGVVVSKAGDRKARFIVQFEGGELSNGAVAAEIQPEITASAGKISEIKVFRATESGSVRVLFDLDDGGEKAIELRLVLMNRGVPKSETWLYRWTQ